MDREDIRNMPEEERPQIVVLDPSRDISSNQLQKEIDQKRDEEDSESLPVINMFKKVIIQSKRF